MSTQTIQATDQASRGGRRNGRTLPEVTDYVGKGRVAACCARRRYNLRPDADEMNELINHAASVYWHYLEVQLAHPSKAWTAARDRSATYYFRKMCDFQRNCRMTAVSSVTVEKVSGDVYSFPA